MRVAGFVLTGGQSTRMGRDKALLPMESQTLCEHIGDVVSSLAGSVKLVGHPERYRDLKYECMADLNPGLGPLSGLETALSFGGELNVVISCDLVNIKTEWLGRLIEEVDEGTLCAVAEDAGGRVQPLCGVYRRECLPMVSRAVAERRLKMMDLVKELDAKLVKIEDAMMNVNTPEQYSETMHGYGRR